MLPHILHFLAKLFDIIDYSQYFFFLATKEYWTQIKQPVDVFLSK